MQNRTSVLSFIVVAAGTAALLATTAQSQLGAPKNYVSLQPTTPGTSQSGHSNVSGTSRAGQFVGGGAGVTNVNAAQLGGLSSTAFGQVSGGNTWTGINSFGNNGNSYTGNGGGLYNVNASLLNGLSSGAFLQSIPNPLVLSGTNANAIIHATNTTSGAEFAAAIRGTSVDDITIAYGGFFESNSVALRAEARLTAIEAHSSEGTGLTAYSPYIGGYFESNQTGVFGEGGVYGVKARTYAGTAVYAESYGPFGGDFFNYATNGKGIRVQSGGAGETFGVHATSSGNQGTAVYGESTSGSGTGFGAQFYSSAPSGSAVYSRAYSVSGNSNGGTFTTSSTGFGAGVQGEAYAYSGPTVAGRFFNNSDAGKGVYAEAGSGTGVTYGIHALVESPDGFAGLFDGKSQFNGNVGIGVLPGASRLQVNGNGADAVAINNTGAGRGMLVQAISDTAVWATTTAGFAGLDGRCGNPSGLGILGYAYAVTGVNYGVLGQTSSASGYGLYSNGNFGASGTKAFRIDHPFDPENKYLLHYSSESPMPQNFYVGNTVTDSQGFAWIELPDYFSEINANFKYQLTVIGKTFAQAIVYEEIVDGRFQIRTNEPNIKVSWRVDADRNDLYVRDRKPKDVVEKQGRERGTYQHPELYGMPAERGVNFRSATEANSKAGKR